jgi:hypothetical protein
MLILFPTFKLCGFLVTTVTVPAVYQASTITFVFLTVEKISVDGDKCGGGHFQL